MRQGYVTPEAAKQFYGVVIDPKSFEIDAKATDALRAQMRKGNGHAHAS